MNFYFYGSRNQGSTPQEEQANTLEPSRSLFALTLTAMCRNPRDFYGQDILGALTKFPFFSAPICWSKKKKRKISKHKNSLSFVSSLPISFMMLTSAPIMALEEDHDGAVLQPFTFAFNAMAVCAGGGHLKRRHVVKLLESINQTPVQTHSIGKVIPL
jgi:hypothetical protein